MQGKRYTAIVLAESASQNQIANTRQAYERIYTQVSPFANMQISYGKNQALSISDALAQGITHGASHGISTSTQTGRSHAKNTSVNYSETQQDWKSMAVKAGGAALLGVASLLTAPLTGGASVAAAGAIIAGQTGLNMSNPKSVSHGRSEGYTHTASQ